MRTGIAGERTWSEERRELQRRRERREWFMLWASFAGALVILGLLAVLGR